MYNIERKGHRIFFPFFLERHDKNTKGRKEERDDVLGNLRQIMSFVYVASYQTVIP